MPNTTLESSESNARLTKLTRKRSQLKANLTRFSNFLGSVKSSEITKQKLVELEIRMSKIEQGLLVEFTDTQLEIENIETNVDGSEIETFESMYYSVLANAKDFIDSQSHVVTNNSNSNTGTSNNQSPPRQTHFKQFGVKLPTIELPKFSGIYENWLEFRDLFLSLIHNSDQIEPIQKFHYLRASLEGSAAQCIKSLEFTSENYEIAWSILCNRFENKQLMVHNHIKSLFNIREVKAESPSSFRDLVDTISKNLKALESLGVSTSQWDPLIIYLVVSKLDSEIVREWEQRQSTNELPTLEDFTAFLCSHADLLEKINLHKNKSKTREVNKSFVASASQNYTFSCYVCKQSHSIYKCNQFLALPVEQRREKVAALKLCFNCLKQNHLADQCKFGHCKHCTEKHNSLLHVNVQPNNVSNSSESEQSTSNRTVTHCNYSATGQVLLSTALLEVEDAHGAKHVCKALLDNASMSNFISQTLVDKLGLQKNRVDISVLGIGQTESNLNYSCNIRIESLQSEFRAQVYCLVIPRITDCLPKYSFDPSVLHIPEHIRLADPKFHKSREVNLLLGAELFWDLVCKGKIHLGRKNPVLQQTRLGWIISGPLNLTNISSDKVTSCNFTQTLDVQSQLSKFWEIEEGSSLPALSQEQVLAEDHFLQTFRRASSGRFIVSIPLKEPITKLGYSKEQARRQFLNLERRLMSNLKLRQMYTDFMDEYERLSHMSKFEPEDNQIVFYSPHHGVLREDKSTTKLRVVFNSSALSSTGVSYNSLQMVGPTIQEDLLSILLRFRQHLYVMSADISKMYRQIEVDQTFRPLQLILWRSNPDNELQTYSLNTVTYGTASAPFLATRCLKQLAIENEKTFPQASNIIGRDFYVDDLLSGANSLSEAVQLCQQVSSILKSGCFELRKWRSNSPQILAGIEASNSSSEILQFMSSENAKTLGLIWSSSEDKFSFHIDLSSNSKKVTKRTILSEIAKIFDPLGLVSPVVVTAKIMLQSLWLLKLSWDEQVPHDLSQKWLSFRSELPELNSLKLLRHISCADPISVQLHGFSDASHKAYGACVYVRTVDKDNRVYVRLLYSKTRVAPIKSISIPRLELCAAQLLAHLFRKTTSSVTLKIDNYLLWSDSTVVLAWLRSLPHNLQPFVGNRVADIQRLTNINNWRYVPTNSNPADILSRGLSPKQIVNSDAWFSGPLWLSQSDDQWPEDISLKGIMSTAELPEVRLVTQSCIVNQDELFPFSRFSLLTRIKRVMAYCLRFVTNIKNPKLKGSSLPLNHEELQHALKTLIKLAQRESFHSDVQSLTRDQSVTKNSKLIQLTPFLDDGIVRVGGRLKHSSYSFSKKHPAVLSSTHHLTLLIFRYYHATLLHCGPQSLLAAVRECYWPLAGTNLAKRVVRECIVCFRCKPRFQTPLMGNLPQARITPRPPFSDTGVDYAGPFFIKTHKGRGAKLQKCYFSLFICLATKAIHLELVTDLSTMSFLETFQRFIARRGKPSHIYSDNGRNFVGVNNHLRDLGKFLKSNQQELTQQIELNQSVKWHFIASYSPHQGGLWEAGVKSAKHHIKRVLSNVNLTFESFYTVITQIESILNSRPLTPLSTNPNDLEVLTPAHFLIGRTLHSIPHPDVQQLPVNRLSHFEQLERLKQHFWSRWKKEYLAQLQQRTKWKTNQENIAVEAMVLINDENLPPFKWRLGRIIALHPGDDSVVRVVSIKTTCGVIKRSVVKVCPLPIDTVDKS